MLDSAAGEFNLSRWTLQCVRATNKLARLTQRLNATKHHPPRTIGTWSNICFFTTSSHKNQRIFCPTNPEAGKNHYSTLFCVEIVTAAVREYTPTMQQVLVSSAFIVQSPKPSLSASSLFHAPNAMAWFSPIYVNTLSRFGRLD